MKNLIMISLTAVLFTAVSCTKFGKNITVKGKILNPITNEPIQGVEVRLLKSDHSDYAGGYKKIQSTISDTDGSFKIEATRLGPIWLSTNITEYEKYYKLGWLDDTENKYYSMKKVDKGKVMNINCHLVPYGNYHLKINNVNCGGGADTMYFRKKWLVTQEEDAYWSTPRIGCYSYNGDEVLQLPMGSYAYEIKVIRSGVTSYVYDTLVVNETGISVLNIEY